MHLDAFDHEVLSFEIIRGPGSLTKRLGTEQEYFVAFDEVCHEIVRWCTLDGQFFNSRSFSEILQATVGKNVQRPQALGDLVNSLKQILVLLLKGPVQLEEVRTLDVPMCKVR